MDKNNIKVTIIIPVYNVENYLEQCLESVISQTLKEIEIICVDDGSTDYSLEILKRYKEHDSRISVFSKPNTGYGHTINYGLQRSHGEYISIVESDDFIDANGMELLYTSAEIKRADYIRANYYKYRDSEDILDESLSQYPYDKVFSIADDLSIFYSLEISPWACLYRRKFLVENNIWMNETPGASYQDNSWQFIVLLRATKVVLLRDAFYHYRIDNMNSSINNSQKVFCVLDEKNYMESKIMEYNISDINILQAFSKLIYLLYKWNYNRIAKQYKYSFLLEWKKELKIQKNSGILKKDFFKKDQWEEINCIMNKTKDYLAK